MPWPVQASPEALLQGRPEAGDLRLRRSTHRRNRFVDAIRGRAQPTSPIDPAVCVDTLCWLDQLASRLGRRLRWDPLQGGFRG